MALIYDSRIRAIDASGNPYVGATLTIYDAGTTTLASVYRDAALTSAMTNPSSGADVSDSGGYFPQIFAAEGSLFDITLKTSGGLVIKTYEDVSALGGSSSSVTRDFGGSRLRIDNDAGTVRFEAGHPVGNDIGGYVSVGGYLGSQADTIELDGASVNTTGTLTENSKKLRGVISDSSGFTAVSSVIIPLTNSPSNVRMWEIDLLDLVPSVGTTLTAQFSVDNGATYVSSATYASVIMAQGISAVTASGSGTSSPTTVLTLFTMVALASHLVRLRVVTPASTGLTMVTGDAHVYSSTGSDSASAFFNGRMGTSSARATHMKLMPASGTFTGRYRIGPQRGFGE